MDSEILWKKGERMWRLDQKMISEQSFIMKVYYSAPARMKKGQGAGYKKGTLRREAPRGGEWEGGTLLTVSPVFWDMEKRDLQDKYFSCSGLFQLHHVKKSRIWFR